MVSCSFDENSGCVQIAVNSGRSHRVQSICSDAMPQYFILLTHDVFAQLEDFLWIIKICFKLMAGRPPAFCVLLFGSLNMCFGVLFSF